jgi:hypothetical protein
MINTTARPRLVSLGALGQLAATRPTPGVGLRAGWLHLPGLTFTLLLFGFALPVVLAANPLEGDIWWVLKNGQALLARGDLGTSDPFTFAAHTADAMNVQWLAQLVYYGAYALLGLEGVAAFNVVVITATFCLVFDIGRRRSGSMLAAALATLLTEFVVIWQVQPRAQTLAFLPFAATAWLLACAPRRLSTIAALAAIQAVWANIHGSFFLAPLLTGLVLTGTGLTVLPSGGWRALLRSAEVRFLLRAGGAQALASLANPYGIGLYAYVHRLTGYSVIRQYATEWMPTNLYQAPGFCFFVSLGCATILLGRRRRGITLGDVFTLGVFALLAFQAVRNVAWWGLAIGPIVAVALADSPIPGRVLSLGRQVGSPRQNLLRAGLIAVLLVSVSPWFKPSNPLLPASWRATVPADYPTAATEFLLSHDLTQRVFADQAWGSYLDWQLWPRYEVMVDSSLETHPREAWEDYIDINAGHVSWQQRLDAYDVHVLLLNPATQQKLIDLVADSTRWQKAYGDELAVIYVPASLGVPSR